VQVDVSVLDRQRQPVRGLTANDFTLLEDGRPQEIVAFAPVEVPLPAPPTAAWMRDTPWDVRTNDLGEGRLFAIIMDDATVPPETRIEADARRIARSVVERLGPADLAAVILVMDSRRSVDFTNDRRRLLAAIDGFKAGTGYADAVGSTNNYLYYASIRTLGQVSTQLMSVPHRRKAVIYVSSGVPVDFETIAKVTAIGPTRPVLGLPIGGDTIEQDTARDLMNAMTEVLAERPQEAFGLAMQDAFIRAQHGNVNIYSVDPAGVGGLQGYLQTNARQATVGGPLISPVEAFQTARLHRDFLQAVSENSGGRAFLDQNQVEEGVAQIFRENSSYYLLGYQSTRAAADRSVRKVTVKINRRDLTAHTRNAYYDPRTQPRTLPAPAPAGLRNALTGILASPDVSLRAAVAPFALTGRSETGLAVVLAIQHPALPGDFGARTSDTLEVLIAAFAPNGTQRGTTRHTARVAGRAGSGDDVRYEVMSQIELPPGRYQLRLAVQSAALNKTGSVYYDVDVPDFDRDPLSLSGIVLSVTPGVMTAPEGAFTPLIPVVPTTERTLAPDRDALAFLRVYQRGRSTPEPVKITTRLADARDRVVRRVTATLEAEQFQSTHAVDYRIPLALADLPPGAYLLTVEAAAGSRTVRRDVRFDVNVR
jgi:VWFA-related protein